MRQWIRTCQECGHQQTGRDPSTTQKGSPSDAYMNSACKKCRSEALDYGSYRDLEAEAAGTEKDYTDDED